ncbi:hypothetical protein SNEBB_006117 [Seison nebaliae]|nr:hypothetical protein SNEBB_006117 [Seison nebaliae]
MKEPISVLITGAAGQIAYALMPAICRGDAFGYDQPINLHLFDIPAMIGSLKGVAMELEDCASALLKNVVVTADGEEAFKNIDYALMVGAMPRKEGMLRKDLLSANVKIFKSQGSFLDKFAKKTCKILVVGNPANTNCFVLMDNAPSIPKENFTCLTRLDQNRATSQVAMKLNVKPYNVRHVTIWGNHSSTQVPDVSHAEVKIDEDNWKLVKEILNDEKWMKDDLMQIVKQRGAAVIAARKLSSAMSAAKAICDHMKSWHFGTKEGEWVSMGVLSDGSYGVEKDLIYSFPLTIDSKGKWSLVKDLIIDDLYHEEMMKTMNELKQEKEDAMKIKLKKMIIIKFKENTFGQNDNWWIIREIFSYEIKMRNIII